MTREDAIRRAPVFTWEAAPRLEARLAEDTELLAARMQQAAASGDSSAQLAWGHMLLEGVGTARDPEAALRWFQLAARSGDAEAINMVGRCHELGWGAVRNTRIAAQAYRAAAETGHAWASFNLAMLMLVGDGAEGDKADILALLIRSARRGNAKAMSFIGRACEEGWRGAPKLESARRWYGRAARRGCFRGAFDLARHLMADGDTDGAVLWLRRSVDAAPSNFCAELGTYLAGHPDVRLREVAALAIERARTAPPVPEFRAAQSEIRSADGPKAPPSVLVRGRRSMGRALRALTGAQKSRRA